SAQWAHVREGSAEPDAFYRYLRTAKELPFDPPPLPVTLPPLLAQALERSAPGADPLKYLANASGDQFHDHVWRHFWFRYVLHPGVLPIWSHRDGDAYVLNAEKSLLRRSDDKDFKKFFVGRADSIKNKLIDQLNGPTPPTEVQAYAAFAANVRDRAHSYREDIDSCLAHVGLLAPDGRPTPLGNQFLDACDRNGGVAHAGPPRALLIAALMKVGNLRAFVHYAYSLSEQRFRREPLAFATLGGPAGVQFDREGYRRWLHAEMANNLRVLSTSTLRGGESRLPFQAELAVLRSFGLINDYRVGVGIELNWPEINTAMAVDL
ncbi:MAG: hypothetical protein ACRC33_05495, partial [Gemmataceae bacterium]